MPYQNILYDRSGGVGTITLNRPGKLNALNFEMLDELWELLQGILADHEVRVVVLTGAGRYFSSGADLEILSTLDLRTFRTFQHKYWNRVFNEFEQMQRLTIAALNGPAIGGGLELALCCDLRYAVEEDATLRMPQIQFGLIPDAGGTVRLPWLMGLAKAKEFILSGEVMSAREAEACGIVNRVFSRDAFPEEIRKIADKMARKPPLAMAIGKQIINRSFQQRDARFGLEDATDAQCILISTEDYGEGVRAFQEKRVPVFRGR